MLRLVCDQNIINNNLKYIYKNDIINDLTVKALRQSYLEK